MLEILSLLQAIENAFPRVAAWCGHAFFAYLLLPLLGAAAGGAASTFIQNAIPPSMTWVAIGFAAAIPLQGLLWLYVSRVEETPDESKPAQK